MSTINLIIETVDISEWVEKESYSVRIVQEYSEEFTNYDGSKIKHRKGFHYAISLNLENIPDSVMRELSSALDSDKISIKFTNPLSEQSDGCTTANFLRGDEIRGEIAYELDDGLRWNTSLSLKSDFFPAGDSL